MSDLKTSATKNLQNNPESGSDKADINPALEELERKVDDALNSVQLAAITLSDIKSYLQALRLSPLPEVKMSEPRNQRDFSKWLLAAAKTYHNKRNFPLAVFKQHVEGQLTLAELEEIFEVDKVYPNPILGNKKVFKIAHDVEGNEVVRFHPDVITTKDKQQVLVTNQLGMNNFPQLIQRMAKTFGFKIKGKDLNPDIWPQPPRPPFVEPDVNYLKPVPNDGKTRRGAGTAGAQ